ncbi:MAG: N-6 DNA methylase [Actinomycetota bacterium]|nr:N-6 DNA methylase [Actinomycetota bacterium]
MEPVTATAVPAESPVETAENPIPRGPSGDVREADWAAPGAKGSEAGRWLFGSVTPDTPMTTGDRVAGFDLGNCLERLAERNPGKTEADIQADVRDLLLYGGFDLGDEHVRLESPAEDQKRIDVEVGAVVIECKRDIRRQKARTQAEHQLAGYLDGRQTASGQDYAGILTDGAEWRYYLAAESGLDKISSFVLQGAEDSERAFRRWLGAILATEHRLVPTAERIEERLGATSPACRLVLAELLELWGDAKLVEAAKLKRSLWAKLLRTALGTQFQDDDSLFVEHTYLAVIANLIGHAVLGFDIASPDFSPAVALTGQLFSQSGLDGVGEAGFFDWVLEADGGAALVAELARRVGCFAWEGADHDVLKVLYQSVIAPETRHRLGEYYTPDWLAEHVVEVTVPDPLDTRVLDPACGSGTFLFHAVRRYLAAAEKAGTPLADALSEATAHVFGLDLHPVAVTLAQVTYLVAMGQERLKARAGRLSVPVYMGDSMRWEAAEEDFFTRSGDVVVPTDDGQRLVPSELRFPAAVVADVGRFDQLVEALAVLATQRAPGAPHQPLRGLFARFGIAEADRQALQATYSLLCELHDEGRDHIWSFYVRNQARPTWFATETHRVDALVGNPPWLSYRYMPAAMQKSFATRAKARHLWAGGKVATHQDLSAFFVARSIELYLRVGGRFAFVMPRAALSRQQYEGFRQAHFSAQAETCAVAFDAPWDLGDVDPEPFPVPAAVVLGRRVETEARTLPARHLRFSGPLAPHGSWEVAAAELKVTEDDEGRTFSLEDLPRSPYAERFRNGATLYPRLLVFVLDATASPVGVPKGQRAVRSRRGRLDKAPWKDLPDHTGVVEEIFVRPTYLGEHVLPFRLLAPAEVVIPYDGTALLSGNADRIDRYPGLAQWWRSAEQAWETHKGSGSTLSLIDQVDYQSKLTAQFPLAPIRVVYSASGNTLAAAVLTNARAVIEHALYWGTTATLDEARYLTAILNAPALTARIRPYQSVGAFGPRHFDKYVWYAPIPEFDHDDPHHRRLVELAVKAEEVAADIEIGDAGFQKARQMVRQALSEEGLADALDAVLGPFLGP